MKIEKKTIRTKRGLREYNRVGCPLTRNRSAWCFRICNPNAEGHGRCGRIAPHGIKGKTQLAIEGHKRKLQKAHLENLEHMYLAAPYNAGHEPGIKISLGEADIVVPIQEDHFNAAGVLSSTICFKAMNDAAIFAVNSLVVDAVALTMSFSISLTRTPATGELLARGRFVGMSGDQYLAESILTDSNGEEIGRGEGALEVRDDPSSANAG